MSKATENAYNWAVETVMDTCVYVAEADNRLITKEYIYLKVEENLNLWDEYVGPRHNNYQEEEYLLTDSQWYDTLHSVRETVECRLECEGLLES